VTMETVAFYSYKGGVGRTLLVANTAQFLAMSGRRVVALDLDLEAPGLHQKLGNREVLARAESGALRGVVDELLNALETEEERHTLVDAFVDVLEPGEIESLNTLETEQRTHSLRQAAIEVDLPSGSNGNLLLLPAGSAPSHAYWAALERLQNALRSNRRNGGLAEAVLELQAQIAEEFAPEFLLIDSRTGITELGGLATSILADRVVCMTTTAPESIEGTRVVAEALRTGPRLSSQRPLRIDFLITRVTGSSHSAHVANLLKELGDSVAVLPHDSAIANEERVLSGWGLGQSTGWDDDDDAGKELFSATLAWIAQAFPGHKQDAERARGRMEAIHRTWQHLTARWKRLRGGGSSSRAAWPVEQLRERVRFESNKKSRQADIVAYDAPADSSTAKPLMIIEYVDSEDRDVVARWWLETSVPVVAVVSDNSERRLYSSRARWDSRAHHSDRWDLPLPYDFKALSDPTDVSVETLLDAVRRGHHEYLDRIVTEWVRCSAATLHGGAPWRPQVAKKIIDELARVDDVDTARHVLWVISRSALDRDMWLGDGDDWLDEQVLSELFAPLLWRLPSEASIDILREGGHRGRPHGRPTGLLALALLARDTLGLRYDPDATFRLEAQRILERARRDSEVDEDRGLYKLAPAFEHTEISFEISSELPPLAMCDEKADEKRQKRMSVGSLLSERIAAGSLVTTGLLGNYLPDLGKVVLYTDTIKQCADKLALRARHVSSVTLIHETIHALAHLGRDLDGRMWPEFALPAANSPLFEPSWFHEVLTQYFTYHHIVRLRDPALLHAFEAMSAKQAPAYRAWQRLRHLPIEDARSWFMSVRRGVGLAAPSAPALVNAPQDES
jgi:MinD-like ATPase involved in chromosome partitioning or flagellar assembly